MLHPHHRTERPRECTASSKVSMRAPRHQAVIPSPGHCLGRLSSCLLGRKVSPSPQAHIHLHEICLRGLSPQAYTLEQKLSAKTACSHLHEKCLHMHTGIHTLDFCNRHLKFDDHCMLMYRISPTLLLAEPTTFSSENVYEQRHRRLSVVVRLNRNGSQFN